ncbi:hypothetical protein [Streptomyces sp. NPDC004008]
MITQQPDGWYDAGCHRACSEQHTYEQGRCALAPKPAQPRPKISIGRVEPMEDGQPSIVLRSIPYAAWESLITVAKWVSRGKAYALDADPDIAPAYPDAAARRALGALHDAGLLDTAPTPAATEATEGWTQQNDGRWSLPFRGGYVNTPAHFTAEERARFAEALAEQRKPEPCEDCLAGVHGPNHHRKHLPAAPDTITDPAYLREQYAAAIRRWWDADDGGAEEIADAVLKVRDRHLQQLDPLYNQLAALRAVARGYCPACGRGDAAPTLDDWERERQRAEAAEALLKRYVDLAAITHKYPIQGGHDCLGENLTCAGCTLAEQAKKHIEQQRAPIGQPAPAAAATQATGGQDQ